MDAPTKRYPCPCTARLAKIDSRPWVTIIEEVGQGLPSQEAVSSRHEPAPTPAPAPSTPANPESDLPPSYDAATAPFGTPSLAHPPAIHPSRVAALPVEQPLPGVEYLSILDRSPPPIRFEECTSCYRSSWSSLWRLSRHIMCALRNANPSPSLVHRRLRYYDEARGTVELRFTEGLKAWELERPARGREDWTADYIWGLSARHGDSAGTWVAEVRLFFSDMAGSLQRCLPWGDEAKTRRLRPGRPPVYVVGAEPGEGGPKYKSSWCYFDDEKTPTWCAEVTLCHESLESLAAASGTGPWSYLEPESCLMAELDQSTQVGTYKKVMWYHHGIGYGNDLLDHPVRPWDEGAMEAYAEFVSPLMPGSGESEGSGSEEDDDSESEASRSGEDDDWESEVNGSDEDE